MTKQTVKAHSDTQPKHACQAFLLINTNQSPLKLKSEIESQWAEIAKQDVCCLLSAALYSPQSVAMYVTASSRQQIEKTVEALRGVAGGAQIEIRLCKQDQNVSGLAAFDTSANLWGLISITLTSEAQTREIEVLSAVRSVSGLQLARACYGQSDILGLINTSTLEDLQDIVVRQIRGLQDVATTSTNLVYELE